MTLPFWRWLPTLALAAMLLPTTALAQGADAVDARSWLARIHDAANKLNYEGTLVFSASGVLSSSRVAHFSAGTQSYERLEALDGRQQRVYRQNDVVYTLWPQSRVAVVEKRTPLTGQPSLRPSVEPRALEQYELHSEGLDRIAGREAKVFRLQPRDDRRYAQRVWADKASGLMLRTDILGADGQALESSAFSEVDIGVKPQPGSVTRAVRNLSGWEVVRPQRQSTELDAEGWSLVSPVPGFTLSGCVKRPLRPAVPARAPAEPVLQAVFSDGLTHVSVFIEGSAARSSFQNLSAQIGATGTYRQLHGQHWITVMGDVPTATLKRFADALQRRP